MVTLFAATYPERTAALVAMGTFARRPPAPGLPDQPAGPRPGPRTGACRSRASSSSSARRRSPTTRRRSAGTLLHRARREPRRGARAHEMNARSTCATCCRRSASRRSSSIARTSTSGRPPATWASASRGAVVRLPGGDHLPWEGDQEAVLRAIEGFLATAEEQRSPIGSSRPCCTRGSPGSAPCRCCAPGCRVPGRARGGRRPRAFDGPARAVRCARALVAAAGPRARASAGLHSGECALDGDATGAPAPLADGVAAAATAGEVLASSTVRDLVAGRGSRSSRAGALPARRRNGGSRRLPAALTGRLPELAANRADGLLLKPTARSPQMHYRDTQRSPHPAAVRDARRDGGAARARRVPFRAVNHWIDGAHNRTTVQPFYGAGQEDTSRAGVRARRRRARRPASAPTRARTRSRPCCTRWRRASPRRSSMSRRRARCG